MLKGVTGLLLAGGVGIMDMLWDGLSLALTITELIHCCGVRQCCIGVPCFGGRPAPPGFSGSFCKSFYTSWRFVVPFGQSAVFE